MFKEKEIMMTNPSNPISSFRRFFFKFSRNLFMGAVIVAFCLGLGMAGYHRYEKMSWIDSYVNAAMILSGMGPVSPLETDAGKIFAGSYALFSGIVFLFVIALIFAPIAHRFLHRFHMEDGIRDRTNTTLKSKPEEKGRE